MPNFRESDGSIGKLSFVRTVRFSVVPKEGSAGIVVRRRTQRHQQTHPVLPTVKNVTNQNDLRHRSIVALENSFGNVRISTLSWTSKPFDGQ